ncbi:MAG: hypothetical protein CO189_04385, partial [candidate division Zixibacteria bacterium CG_4_9_14_3_um_filter_46_8]
MKIKRYLPFLIGLVLLIICFYDYDYRRINSIIQGVNYYILFPVLAFEVVNLYVRSQRLRVILNPIIRINGASIFSYYSIGSFANAALPALSGQVVRTLLFARKYKITKTSIATGAILETLFDGLCLFGLMIGISFMVKLPEWLITWKFGIGIVVISIAGLLVLVSYNNRFISRLCGRF